MHYKLLFLGILSIFILNTNAQTKIFKNATTRNQVLVCSYKVFLNDDHTYGYDIFQSGKIFIHQPNIPGRRGLHGFRNRKDAEKVAILVIKKIKAGQMPPVVLEEDLIKLKI